MAYQYSYAWEKFGRAIYTLATGKDEIRRRLLLVFQGDLLLITPEHLLDRIRSDYRWIMDQLTKYDEKYSGEKNISHQTTVDMIISFLQKWRQHYLEFAGRPPQKPPKNCSTYGLFLMRNFGRPEC